MQHFRNTSAFPDLDLRPSWVRQNFKLDHPLRRALERNVDARAADRQATESNAIEPAWKQRAGEGNALAFAVDLETEHRLQQVKDSAASPGLRRAGYGVADGGAASPAPKAAEELGQAPIVHHRRRVGERLKDLLRPVAAPASGETGRNQRRVMGPDRAVVIGHRVVARLALGNGPHAPPRVERGSEHRVCHRWRACL